MRALYLWPKHVYGGNSDSNLVDFLAYTAMA